MRPFSVLAGTLGVSATSSQLSLIPTVNFVAQSGNLSLKSLTKIVVDSSVADWVDYEGQTLIPPTLEEFGQTFKNDIQNATSSTYDFETANWSASSIYLTIQNGSYLDAAGRHSSEGYTLSMNANGVNITGASSLGAWWGTRTFLQLIAVNSGGSLPIGSLTDIPGWGTRGIMLDAARHYYPPSFITQMCSYLSFFKQNVFHLHLSDNLFSSYVNNTDVRENLYSAFRLVSTDPAVAGLNKRQNESYSYEVFEDMQKQCASRGVTIIPEIEAPGHALVITQWKPELALDTDPTLLNISEPETIPTMKTIWKTFLPWMHSKTVHIGADEYSSKFVSDYNYLVNELSEYITAESGKSVRIWGTFPYNSSYTDNIARNVSIQHWEFFEDNPYFQYIKNGYSVVNSDDSFYIVNKWSGSYPQYLNKTRIFHGNPATGGQFAPNIFDTKNATNNPPPSEPLVEGHIAAMWNDYGPNATVYSEAYYGWRDNLPALADKQWGGNITENQYDLVFDTLHAAIPGQNLDMAIRSKSQAIFQYDFTKTSGNTIYDQSGNGYNGTNHGCAVKNGSIVFDGNCYVSTPLEAKGRNYTLSFSVMPTTNQPGALFSSAEQSLVAGNGTISNVTFIADGNPYSLNYTLPANQWSYVELQGQGNQTFLTINNSTRMEFTARLGINGERFVWAPMAIPAPLAFIGQGFKGMMGTITLKSV